MAKNGTVGSSGAVLTLAMLKGARYLASGLVLMTNGYTAHFAEVLPLINEVAKPGVAVGPGELKRFLAPPARTFGNAY